MEIDFTSSLYLGFWHESFSIRLWSRLTTGVPAALDESAGSDAVARQLARLQGCEQATLARSTLHLFWDLFGMLADEQIAIFLDKGAYPIARWGVDRAKSRGIPVHLIPHKDADALRHILRRGTKGRKPVIVSDGICTACGCVVPVARYHELTLRDGGMLIVDDTQALGILGTDPDPEVPYGKGGGGSLRYQNISGRNIIVISSLAKGFGVPLAILSGSSDLVQKFKAKSQTRVHCSPPSEADIYAAEHALKLNAERGDSLRLQLAQRVHQFRLRLANVGISADGGFFPVQTLRLPTELNLGPVHQHLLNLGIRTIMRRGCVGGPRLSLIITARHSLNEIENAVQAIAKVVNEQPQPELEGG